MASSEGPGQLFVEAGGNDRIRQEYNTENWSELRMQEERSKIIGGGMWACKGAGAQMSSHQQSLEGGRDLDLANKLVEILRVDF